MPLPALHVVTDDDVLAASGFRDRARAVLHAGGPGVALHLRGPRTPVSRLYTEAAALAPLARRGRSLLLVNDRVDVALAVGADGVQLGARSLPVDAVRALRRDWMIGVSTHGVGEAVAATGDFVILGTIWETPSHPGRRGAGLERVREAVERVAAPVVAIGGVTAERAGAARQAGAHGVAVIRGVWGAASPAAAVAEYLEALDAPQRGDA